MHRAPIRIGIIGTGTGLRMLLPAFVGTGSAEVVALSGSSQTRAEELGRPYGIPLLTGDYREVCASRAVELVCVASPNDLHLEHALAALASDKHVYLEKPVGLDADEARLIAEAARSHRRIVLVGHSLRFNPYIQAMRMQIGTGAIGRVYSLTIDQRGSSLAVPSSRRTWSHEVARGGGVRLGMGSHMFDLARFLLEADPLYVFAASDAVHPGESADAFFSAAVRYPTGFATLTASAAAHVTPFFTVVAHGELGDLTFDDDTKLLHHRAGRMPVRVVEADADVAYERRRASSVFATSFAYLADATVAAIAGDANHVPNAATARDAVGVMVSLDAALQASIEHTSVDIASC